MMLGSHLHQYFWEINTRNGQYCSPGLCTTTPIKKLSVLNEINIFKLFNSILKSYVSESVLQNPRYCLHPR